MTTPVQSLREGTGPVTVKLRLPITIGSKVVEELTFRPLKAKDLRRLQVTAERGMDVILTLAGRLSGQPDAVIDQLEGADLAEVIDLVGGFMPAFQPTGRTSSED